MSFSFHTAIVPATQYHTEHIACYVNDAYVGRLRVVDKKLKFRGPGMVFHRSIKNVNLCFEETRPLAEIEQDPIVRRYLASYALMNAPSYIFAV